MRFIAKILLLAATVSAIASCSGDDNEKTPVQTVAKLNCNAVAKGYETGCGLLLQAPAGTGYVATVTSGKEWCLLSNSRLEEVSGTMFADEDFVWVKFSKNESEEVRYAVIKVVFDNGYEFELDLRQMVYDAPQDYDKPWNELPKYVENSNYIYYTHSAANLLGQSQRNYSFCFDITKHASLWVAYPLHTCYTTGSANRSNSDFGFDPNVTSSYQANLVGHSYVGPYDRGHQIPAADRKCTQTFMNQTFYATNMTPQQSNFNQKLWGSLEGKVRDQICSDTLYVVTGAYFGGVRDGSIVENSADYTGVVMPTPTHYYKLLLRTVSGSTGQSVDSFSDASKLQAIGVWLTHANTGNSTALPAGSLVSVKEIEAITGFSYFNMLDPNIADAVKSQCDPSKWSGLQ